MSWLGLYHRLPYPGRCLAASLRGLQLERWRYGRETERLVEEALERESWSDRRWQVFQEETLARLLHRAATRVPFYRAFWERRKAAGDRRKPEVLAHWPVLRKDHLRGAPAAFLAEDCDPRSMFHEHTSGSTGTPVELWWSRATSIAWYALVEARLRRWHGVSRHQPWALLGGQLVTPTRQSRPPFWVVNYPQRQLYLSAYHLAPQTVAAYLGAITHHRATHLLGYPSGLGALAALALAAGLEAPRLAVVLGNAEPLFEHQRRDVSRLFGCPVRETYGMAELACAASECEESSLHVWPEVGVVEVLAEGSPEAVEPGTPGRLIATGLLNADMPLIRYEVGDRVTLDPDPVCACGRSLPRLRAVEGRLDDLLLTPDGRRIGRLDPVFKGGFPLREAQIEQVSRRRVILRLVAAEGFSDAHKDELRQRLLDRLGPGMTVTVQLVEALARTKAGKLQAVISRIEEP